MSCWRSKRTHSSVDQPRVVSLLPQSESAYTGRPAVSGHHVSPRPLPHFRRWSLHASDDRAVANDLATRVIAYHQNVDGTALIRQAYAIAREAHEVVPCPRSNGDRADLREREAEVGRAVVAGVDLEDARIGGVEAYRDRVARLRAFDREQRVL